MKWIDWLLWPMRLSIVGGGGGGDGGAGEMRRLEEERQARIRAGSSRVNEIFGGPVTTTRNVTTQEPYSYRSGPIDARAGSYGRLIEGVRSVIRPVTETRQAPGQFGDDYYSDIGRAFRNYYMPQVDQQFQDAQRAIKLSSPSLQSSSYARRAGELSRDYERHVGDVEDRALGAEAEARRNVENSRAAILAAVRSGAGAEEAANSATEAARSLRAPPTYSPLGDLFARYLTTAANATVAANEGYQPTPLNLNTLFKRKPALSTVG